MVNRPSLDVVVFINTKKRHRQLLKAKKARVQGEILIAENSVSSGRGGDSGLVHCQSLAPIGHLDC